MKRCLDLLKWILYLALGFLAVVFVFQFFEWLVLEHTPQLAAKMRFGEEIGVFGDSAGFSNALFSALAFAAVVISLFVQIAQNNKNNRLSRQAQFENNFFQMAGMLEDIISHLEVGGVSLKTEIKQQELNSQSYGASAFLNAGGVKNADGPLKEYWHGGDIVGRQVFRYIYEAIPSEGGFGIKGIVSANPNYDIDQIRAVCFDGTLDHYFRYLYRVLKYVDSSELIDDKERYGYASVLRGQLSCYELLVLFFNCLGMDKNKFKHLIETYSMFNNLRVDYLPTQEMINLYGRKQNGIINDREFKNNSGEYAARAFRRPEAASTRRRIGDLIRIVKDSFIRINRWHQLTKKVMLPHL